MFMELRRAWKRFLRTGVGPVFVVILLVLGCTALFADMLAPYNPVEQNLRTRLHAPSAQHWFGTDDLGRDVLSRVLHGGRISLMVGVASTGFALLFGVPIGILSAVLGGRWDRWMMHVLDGLLSFPALLLALGLVTVLGPSVTNTIISIGVIYAPRLARFARALTLSVKNEVYVEAAMAVGSGLPRLMFKHILPNISSGLFVQAALTFGFSVLVESSLSFLGAGVQPPQASWGSMLRNGFSYMEIAWWLAVAPGVAIALLVLATNVLGDALRDVFDARVRL